MWQCGSYSTVVPVLLRRLESPAHFMEERQALDSLRFALISCGDPDDASYAAVPHLARLGKTLTLPAWEWIALIAEVEARRVCRRGAAVPADLAEAYQAAVVALPQLIADCRPPHCTAREAVAFAGALAIALGHARLGLEIWERADEPGEESGPVTCPV
jgi:hypothetical protein